MKKRIIFVVIAVMLAFGTLNMSGCSGKSIPVTDASEFKFDPTTGTIVQFIGTSTEINIPQEINGVTVQCIGTNVFKREEITAVNIPEGVTLIDFSAFEECEKLEHVYIPDSITEIGGFAFYSCSSLKSINIPDSVTKIDVGAFNRCSSLKSINIPDSVTDIHISTFGNCSSLKSIKVSHDNEYYTSVDGILFTKALTEICCYPCAKSDKQYTIPDNVQTIRHAFEGCNNLEKIQIPESVKAISSSAFYNCAKLKDITIPDSVTRICGDTFYGCPALKNIDLPDNIKDVYDSSFGDTSAVLRCTKGSLTEKNLIAAGYEERIEYY